jgi:hypothetical protein
LETPNAADTYGVYAATEGNVLSLIIINKDTKPLALYLTNLPSGNYFFRHFGGAAGVAKWQVNQEVSSHRRMRKSDNITDYYQHCR